MKKLQLTKHAQVIYDVINNLFDNEDDKDDYLESLTNITETDHIDYVYHRVTDLKLYVDGVYVENKFDDLNDHAQLIAAKEYNSSKYLVLVKIKKAINDGYLEVVDC